MGRVDGVTALHAAAGSVSTWLKAWNRNHGGGRARGDRLRLEERLPLVRALLARGADPNARMTASDVTGQGFVRNGAYDTFATGTGDVAGATPLWVAAVRDESRTGQRLLPGAQPHAELERRDRAQPARGGHPSRQHAEGRHHGADGRGRLRGGRRT